MKKSLTCDAAIGVPTAVRAFHDNGEDGENNNNDLSQKSNALSPKQQHPFDQPVLLLAPLCVNETSSILDSSSHRNPSTDDGDSNATVKNEICLINGEQDEVVNDASFVQLNQQSEKAPNNDRTSTDPVFAETSFLIFKRDNLFRKLAYRFITWQWFERFSIFVIIVNCVCLGAVDPCDADCATVRCQTLAYAEHAIFAFFLIEMLLKMFAMGVFGKGSYLAETWNRFDFFIVITGIIEYMFVDEDLNISAIRAFRVFRPLRAITRIPSLRLLILLLLDTMPMLGNVLLFCCLVFFIFGIAGVQLLAGVLRHRCFFPLLPLPRSQLNATTQTLSVPAGNNSSERQNYIPPPYFMPPYYHRPDGDYICSPGDGLLRCSEIPLYEEQYSMCAELFGVDNYEARLCRDWVGNYSDCRSDGPNPAKGSLSFDHIGAAWMAIFQVISLEGWTKVMYYVQDAYSFWIWIYFLMLVITGSFFAVNLCLVVIATQFSETKRRETQKMKLERRLERNLSVTSAATSGTLGDQGNFYTQLYDIIAQLIKSVLKSCFQCRKDSKERQSKRRGKQSAARKSVEVETAGEDCTVSEEATYEVLNLNKTKSNGPHFNDNITCDSRPVTPPPVTEPRGIFWRIVDEVELNRAICRRVLEHYIATGIVISVIIINAIFMSLEHYGQPDALTKMFAFTDPFFAGFFAIEVLLKIYAYGFPLYIRDCLNLLDLITVVINLVEMFHGRGSKLSVLRTFRLLRVLKLFRFLPALQRQLYVMLRTIDNIATFFILLSFFLFIFALLGMSLFGCRFCPYYDNPVKQRGLTTVPTPTNSSVTAAERWLIGKDGYNCLFSVMPSESGEMTIIPLVAPTQASLLKKGAGLITPTEDLTPAERHLLAYYTCPRANFDSLLLSLFTVLQVFTQDAWSLVLIDGVYYGSDWAGLYFVALVTIGNYVLFNLLVAILVEGFSNQVASRTDADGNLVKGEETFSTSSDSKPDLAIESQPENVANLQPPEIVVNDYGVDEIAPTEQTDNIIPLESFDSGDFPRPRRAIRVKRSPFRRFISARLKPFRERADYSLYLLSSSNPFRKCLRKIILSSQFDNIILVFILANCCAIMVERPSIKRGSFERYCLDISNYVFNGLFLIEACAKIIAMGLIFGPETYLKSGWNVLDFFLVNCSTVYTALELFSPKSSETKILEIFRVLRLLRALRPLRVVNRAPGLKIVVETLLLSIKPIGNVIIICLTFFLIYGILGVQLFQGCFYECSASRSHVNTTMEITAPGNATQLSHYSADRAQLKVFELLYTVRTKADCLALGFEWTNESLNFDNVFQALMTLFVFATFDGWVDITRDAIDCVGIDKQPIRDYNPWNVVFFISFLLIVCFFILNMFVGVVVHNFQEVQERVRAEFKAKRIQMKQEKLLKRLKKRTMDSNRNKLLVKLRKLGGGDGGEAATTVLANQQQLTDPALKQSFEDEDLAFLEDYPYWRLIIYQIFTHKYFELALAAITAVNILVMAIEYYQMPRELKLAVVYIGYAFTGLLVLEVIAKVAAFGVWRYINDRWNQLDLAIVILSLGAIYIEDENSEPLPINPTIIRVARIVRIARVFKLLKTAAGIRRLLDTVGRALPQVGNLTLFFLLLFFIYASLGVELFGKFQCQYGNCEGLSRHANYGNFGIALLTLFRIFTGDDWNGILKDMLRISSNKEECLALTQAGSHSLPDRDFSIECTIAGVLAPFYFVSFVLLSQFVLINVVVAVLMNELEEAHRRDAMERLSKQEKEEQKNVEEKAAEMEELVKTACKNLVDELQAKWAGTTREQVIGIVSAEYLLREEQAAANASSTLTTDVTNRPMASSDSLRKLMATRLILSPGRSDSMCTINVERKHGAFRYRQEATTNVDSNINDERPVDRVVLSVNRNVLEQVFRDLGKDIVTTGANAGNNKKSSVVDDFVELHHRRSFGARRCGSLRGKKTSAKRRNNNNDNNLNTPDINPHGSASFHDFSAGDCPTMANTKL